MKRSMIALSLLAVMSVSACAGGQFGTWTPMSDGRTAGDGTVVEKAMPKKGSQSAERVFSDSLRK